MRKIRKVLCEGLLWASMPLVVWLFLRHDAETVMDVPVITQERAQALTSGLGEQDPDADVLAFDGGDVSYSWWDGITYIPQSMRDAEWNGSITVRNAGDRLYFIEDEYFADKAEAIREAHIFQYLLICEAHYETGRIVFTGLPTVNITYDEEEGLSFDEETTARIQVTDPERKGGGYPVIVSNCLIHLRGQASVGESKENYRVKLLNAGGEKRNENLLGIRDDDDWVLNAMLCDPSKLRERTAYEVWRRINQLEERPIYAVTLEYVELFINQEYRGVYALMPPVDGKAVGLKEGDILYKLNDTVASRRYDGWENRTDMEIVAYFNEKAYAAVSVKFPNEWNDTMTWEPMRLYTRGVLEDAGIGYPEANGMEVNVENLISHHWFLVLTGLADNNWHNSFLVAEALGNGRYRLSREVWDLDWSLGRGDDFDSQVYIPEDFALTDDCAEPEYPLLTAYAPEVRARAAEKWRLWKENGIDEASLCRLVDESAAQLTESGALAREQFRWPEYNTENTAEEIKEWIHARYTLIDAYMAEE